MFRAFINSEPILASNDSVSGNRGVALHSNGTNRLQCIDPKFKAGSEQDVEIVAYKTIQYRLAFPHRTALLLPPFVAKAFQLNGPELRGNADKHRVVGRMFTDVRPPPKPICQCSMPVNRPISHI